MQGFSRGHLTLGCCLSLIGTATQAQPAPTTTSVENTARTIYNSGSANYDVPTNTLSIQVDELIDVGLTSLAAANAVISNDPTAIPFAVVNTGRGPEAFIIRVNPEIGSGRFTPSIDSIMIDTNGNGLAEPGIDRVIANGGVTPEMEPGQQIQVFVIASLPPEAVDRAAGTFSVMATAATGSGNPGAVIASAGTSGTDAIIGRSGAQQASAASLVAALATVTTAKSSTIVDPLGGTRAVSGSRITFQLAATATGSGSARGVRLVDAIPSGTTYVAGSMTIDGRKLSDIDDSDAGSFTANSVNVALGTVNGGERRVVGFSVIIK